MLNKRIGLSEFFNKAKDGLLFCSGLETFDKLFKNEFFLFNAFIADHAYRQELNLYIGMHGRDVVDEAVVPVLYPRMIDALINCAVHLPPDDELIKNHIFIKDKKSYIYEYYENKHTLKTSVTDGSRRRHFPSISDFLKDYYIADKDCYSNRKRHANLDVYNKFCSEDLKREATPFFFKQKIVVVCKKRTFFDQIQALGMRHQIPVGELRSGRLEISDKNLPIDPLIIIASDYEQARNYMLNYKDKYEFVYLLIAGENRMSKIKALVINDNANKLFNRFCLMGNQLVSTERFMKLWHWSKSEELTLMGRYNIEIRLNIIPGCESLLSATNKLYDHFKELSEDYDLYNIVKESKYLLRCILNDKLNNRVGIESLLEQKKEEMQQALLAENYDMEDAEDIVNLLIENLKQIFEETKECPEIWSSFIQDPTLYNATVVNNQELEVWEQASVDKGFPNMKIIKLLDFKRLTRRNSYAGNFLFPFLPSANHLYWLMDQHLDKKNTIDLLLYPPEASIFRFYQKLFRKNERVNSGQKSKDLFPGIDFTLQEHDDNDIFSKFEDAHLENYYDDNFNEVASTEYSGYVIEVIDKDKQTVRMECSQRLLKRSADGIVSANVVELEENDIVILYNNVGQTVFRNTLFEESDTFRKVDVYSELWKQRLFEYLSKSTVKKDLIEDNYDQDIDMELLKELALQIGIRPEYIKNSWLQEGSQIVFPQKNKLFRLIEILQRQGYLSIDEASEIRYYRSFYNGICISMGLNLSIELQSILLNNPDDLSEFISQNVIDQKDDYPLLYKIDPILIKVFLALNFQEYTFIRFIDQQEGNDEAE